MFNQTNPTSGKGFLDKFKAQFSWKRLLVTVGIYALICIALWNTAPVRDLKTDLTFAGWSLTVGLAIGFIAATSFVKGFFTGFLKLKTNLVTDLFDQVIVWLALAGSMVLVARWFPDKATVAPTIGVFILYGALGIAGFIDRVVGRKFFPNTES